MIHSIYYHGDETPALDLKPAQLRAALQDPAGVLWVDADVPTADETQRILVDLFHFHPLTIEDCTGDPQRPKIEDFGTYMFLVTHAPVGQMSDRKVETTEFDVYMGTNYVVTYHQMPVQALEEHRTAVLRDVRLLARGADRLAADILEHVAGDYLTVLDDVDTELDALEDLIFGRPDDDTVNRLFQVRRQLSGLRRLVAPQREVLNRLAWDSFQPIRAENRIYFREAYDRLVRVTDLIENLRDLASGGLETYLSVTSNRLNLTMRWMAAVNTVLLPLTLIASFYGMNFTELPPFGHVPVSGAWIVLIGMVVIAGIMAAIFRKREWF